MDGDEGIVDIIGKRIKAAEDFLTDEFHRMVIRDFYTTKEKKMTQEEYFKQFIVVADRMIRMTKAKNTDYADYKDAFANFSMIESLSGGRITTEDGIITRITDKLKRVCSLLSRPASIKSESITDTVLDMAVYSVILLIYLEDKLDVQSEGVQQDLQTKSHSRTSGLSQNLHEEVEKALQREEPGVTDWDRT